MPPSLSDAAAKLNVDTAVQLSPSGEPVPEFDDEQVASVSPAVQFVFGETLDAGAGTLFVTNRCGRGVDQIQGTGALQAPLYGMMSCHASTDQPLPILLGRHHPLPCRFAGALCGSAGRGSRRCRSRCATSRS